MDESSHLLQGQEREGNEVYCTKIKRANREIASLLSPYGNKAANVNSRFTSAPSNNISELRTSKSQRSYKIPYDLFDNNCLDKILTKCGIVNEKNELEENEIDKEQSLCVEMAMVNDITQINNTIRVRFNGRKINVTKIFVSVTPEKRNKNVIDFERTLTPETSKKFEILGEYSRKIFEMGYKAGAKRKLNDAQTSNREKDLEAAEKLTDLMGTSPAGTSTPK